MVIINSRCPGERKFGMDAKKARKSMATAAKAANKMESVCVVSPSWPWVGCELRKETAWARDTGRRLLAASKEPSQPPYPEPIVPRLLELELIEEMLLESRKFHEVRKGGGQAIDYYHIWTVFLK